MHDHGAPGDDHDRQTIGAGTFRIIRNDVNSNVPIILFTHLMTRVCPYRYRMNEADKDLGQHHALNIYRVVGLLSQPLPLFINCCRRLRELSRAPENWFIRLQQCISLRIANFCGLQHDQNQDYLEDYLALATLSLGFRNPNVVNYLVVVWGTSATVDSGDRLVKKERLSGMAGAGTGQK